MLVLDSYISTSTELQCWMWIFIPYSRVEKSDRISQCGNCTCVWDAFSHQMGTHCIKHYEPFCICWNCLVSNTQLAWFWSQTIVWSRYRLLIHLSQLLHLCIESVALIHFLHFLVMWHSSLSLCPNLAKPSHLFKSLHCNIAWWLQAPLRQSLTSCHHHWAWELGADSWGAQRQLWFPFSSSRWTSEWRAKNIKRKRWWTNTSPKSSQAMSARINGSNLQVSILGNDYKWWQSAGSLKRMIL